MTLHPVLTRIGPAWHVAFLGPPFNGRTGIATRTNPKIVSWKRVVAPRGFTSICGSDVSRLVEGLGSPKAGPPGMACA